MNTNKSILITLFFLFTLSLFPQKTSPEKLFDFWVGKWSLTWKDKKGNEKHGFNQIDKILDGKVIKENFDSAPGMKLRGTSVSSYDARARLWKQTWVDNQGSYLDFSGKFEDGKMILSRTIIFGGRKIQQRMVWYNIDKSSLDWNWENSTDNGRNWKVLWQIRYTRID